MSWRSGRAYSQDFRDKVLAAFDAGEPARDVAERFSVSVSYVYKADLRRRRTGDSSPGPQRCHIPLRLDAHRDALLAHVADHSDATIAELQEWLATEHHVRVCYATLWKTLRRFGLTFKKSPSGRRSRIVRMSPPAGRPGVRISPG
jgi:transposase